jgi:hypothetical protein
VIANEKKNPKQTQNGKPNMKEKHAPGLEPGRCPWG